MLTGSVIAFLLLSLFIGWFYQWLKRMQQPAFGRRRKPVVENTPNTFPRHPPKPEWVIKEVIRLKALMPHDGQRKIADAFNRLYSQQRNMTVGKTFVGYRIRDHQYEIQVLRRKLKHQRPKPVPPHLIGGMDLTGKTDTTGNQHTLFGIVEHHSRACLTLSAIADKSAITLLRIIFDLIERYPKLKLIRTDNEAVFTSRLFRLGLWLLRIKHQRTEVCCPWQNGKVERFFGTLKEKLNQWDVDSFPALNHSLALFRCWYNHIRPHQYLHGLTPAEVWQGNTDCKKRHHKPCWFEAWDGLLTGYYLPP